MNYEELMDVVFPSDELIHYGIPQTPDGKGSGRYKKDFSPKKDAKRLKKELNKQDYKNALIKRDLDSHTFKLKRSEKKYKKLKTKYGEEHKKTIKAKALRDTFKSKVKDETAKYKEGQTLLYALALEGQMKGYRVTSRPLVQNNMIVVPKDPYSAAVWTGYYLIRDVLFNKINRSKYYVTAPKP
jgi:hypothetical protein